MRRPRAAGAGLALLAALVALAGGAQARSAGGGVVWRPASGRLPDGQVRVDYRDASKRSVVVYASLRGAPLRISCRSLGDPAKGQPRVDDCGKLPPRLYAPTNGSVGGFVLAGTPADAKT